MSTDNAPIVIDTYNAAQTAAVGAVIGRHCSAGDIVALQGELGAGKTQFVRGLAEGMGLNPQQVSSPTFVLAQEYEPQDAEDTRPLLVHIDAYRINSDEDLTSIGWHGDGRELREGAVVAVEWASLIRPALGGDLLWVELHHESRGRRILLSAQGAWSAKMQVVRQALRDAGLIQAKGAEP